jgi:cytochrome c oxidase subunit II
MTVREPWAAHDFVWRRLQRGFLASPPASSLGWSTFAHQENWLYLGLLIVAFCVLALVFGLMLLFCVRYRRTSPVVRGGLTEKSWHWEVSWTAATLLAFIGLFFWGAELYLETRDPPADAETIYVVG